MSQCSEVVALSHRSTTFPRMPLCRSCCSLMPRTQSRYETEHTPKHALLSNTNISQDIKLFINSPGGSVTAGMGIYDAMQMCRADVQTYCFGLAASMGAFLLGAGAKGKRWSMPNARIMIHQPLGGASGQAVDIEIQAREIMYHKANLNRIMSGYTGQPIEKVEEDTDRDRYMSPLEAREYGLIDNIIGGDEAVFKVCVMARDVCFVSFARCVPHR